MAASEEVAAGYVSLYARMDSSQVSGEVSKALSSAFSGNTVSNALSSFSSFSTKAGTVLTGGLMLAAHKLPDMIGDVLQTISTTQSADLALTTMFTPEFDGDVSAANAYAQEYIDYLNDFAIKTPFGFESALSGARTLIAMGFEGSEVLNELGDGFDGVLQWSGDMTAALGGDASTFNNIILQLGHMKSLGHVMSYQMNALARNGVPAWRALAQYINEAGIEIEGFEEYTGNWDVEKVREATRAGAMSSDVGLAALQWYSEQNYGGMMEKESHTFRGIMMNMEDAIQTPIRTLYRTSAYSGFTEALYNMLDPLREFVTALLPTFEKAFKRVTPVIEFATDKLNGMTKALKSGKVTSDQILGVIEGLGMLLATGPLALAAGGTASAFSDIAEAAEGVSGVIGDKLGGAVDGLGKKFSKTTESVKTNLGKMTKSAKEYASTFSQVREDKAYEKEVKKASKSYLKEYKRLEGLQGVGSHFGDPSSVAKSFEEAFPGKNLADYNKTFGQSFKDVGAKATDAAKKVGHGFATMGQAGLSATTQIASAGLSIFSSFSKATIAGASILGVIGLVGTAAAGAFVAMGGNMSALGGEIKNVLSETGTTVMQIEKGLLDAFNTIIAEGQMEDFFKQVTQGIYSFIYQVGAYAPQFMEAFGTVFDQVMEGIIGLLAEFLPSLVEGAMQLFTGLITGLTTIVNKLTAVLPTLLGGIFTAIIDNLPALIAAAASLFNGLVDAFSATVPVVVEQLPVLISTLYQAFQDNKATLLGGAWFLFFTIVDAIKKLIPTAIEALAGLVTDLANAIDSSEAGEFATQAGELLGQIGYAIGQALPVALGALGDLLGALAGKLPEFIQDFLAGGASFIMNLVNGFTGGEPIAITDIGEVVGNFIGELLNHAGEFLNAGIGWIGNIINGLFGAKTALASEADGVADDTSENLSGHSTDFVGPAIEWIKAMCAGFVANVSDFIGNVKTFVGDVIAELGTHVSEFIQSVIDWIVAMGAGFAANVSDFIANVKEFVGNVITELAGHASEFIQSAIGWLVSMGAGFIANVSDFITNVKTFVGDVITELGNHAEEFVSGAIAWLVAMGAGLVANTAEVIGNIKQLVDDVLTEVSSPTFIDDLIAAAIDWLVKMGGGVVDNISEVTTKIGEVIQGAIDAVGEYDGDWIAAGGAFLGSMIQGILGGIASFGSDLWNIIDTAISSIPILGDLWKAGKDLIGGLTGGVTDNIDEAVAGIDLMTTEMIDEAKDELEIHSPSRVFMEIGEFVIDGLNDGITDSDPTKGLPSVKSSLTGYFSGSDTWLKASGSNLVKGLGNGISGSEYAATNAMQLVKNAVSDKLGDSSTFLNAHGKNVTGGFASGISGAKSSVSDSVQTLKNSATGKLSDALTLLSGKGGDVAGGFSSGISGKSAAVETAVKSLKKSTTGALSDASTLLNGKGGNVAGSFANGVNSWNSTNAVANAAVALSNAAKNNIDTNTYSLGTNFASGLSSGIWAMVKNVKYAATSMANSAYNAVKSVFKIASPSRVMREVGQFFGEGLGLGIADMADYVAGNAAGVAGSAIDAVSDEFAPSQFSSASSMFSIAGGLGYDGPTVEQMAQAFASQLGKVGVYLSANETSAQLAPSMDRALGRLSYMGV